MMEAADSSEIPAHVYPNIRRHMPEDSKLFIHSREALRTSVDLVPCSGQPGTVPIFGCMKSIR